MLTPRLSAAGAFLFVVLAVAVRLVRGWQWRRLADGARVVEVFPPPRADLAGGRALWDQLAGLLSPAWRRLVAGQPHLCFEVVITASGVRFQVWVPGTVPPGVVEHALAAAWPGTTTRTRPAAPALPAARGQRVVGVQFGLGRDEVFPLRTQHEEDPLRGLLAAAADLRDRQCVVVQVAMRPVAGRRLMRAHTHATQLRQGSSASPGLKTLVFDALTPGHHANGQRRTGPVAPHVLEDVRAIIGKARHHRYATAVRAAATGPANDAEGRAQLRGLLHGVAGAFAVFAEANHLRRHRFHRPGRTINTRRLGRGFLLSTPELAALAHLPADEAVPGLTRAGARPAAPAPETLTGEETGPPARVLGDAELGPQRPIALGVADGRHHVHVLGKTGSGKSTLLANLVLADAEAGRAAVVIDPRGDLVTDLLSRLPEKAAARVVLFDPADRAAPPRLNMLQTDSPETTSDMVVGIFARIFAAWWGPRTDDILRAACLTLTRRRDPQTTLGDIPRLLADDAYRRRITTTVTDPVLRDFWTWYDHLSAAGRTAATGPVLNKLRTALLRPWVRQVIASGPSTIDLPRLLDGGGLVLLRLPKGMLGEDTASLLGSCMLAATWQATTARARRPEHQRPDATCFVDECHNFLNMPGSLADMLAEARGYRLSMVLAHQNLSQLPAGLREAVAANCRSKIYFTASPEDATQLEGHVLPELGGYDIAHLGAYQAATRLFTGGRELPACTLRTRPLPPAVRGRATALRKAARTYTPASTHAPATHPPAPARTSDPRAA